MLILTETTPNPEALKLLPHVRLTDGRTWTFRRQGRAVVSSPLAEALFACAPVLQVFVAVDFVTVTKEPATFVWDTVRLLLIAAMAEHLQSGEPTVRAGAVGSPPVEGPLEGAIRQVLAIHVRPSVARDGGDVVFDRFDLSTGILWVRMEGACGGCPSARRTLKDGVERIMRARIPEVTRIVEVEAAEESDPRGEGRTAKLAAWRASAHSAPHDPRSIFRYNGRPAEAR